MVELPILKRCCFCMPLKEGLVVFGIVKLISVVITIIWMTNIYCGGSGLQYCHNYVLLYNMTLESVLFGVLNFLAVTDFLFTVMMLTGVILRDAKLTNISYYYTLMSMGKFFLIGAVVVALQIFELATEEEGSLGTLLVILLLIFEIAFLIPAVLMFEFYMFLLIRSLNHKVTCEINFSFKRSDPDYQCLLVMEKKDIEMLTLCPPDFEEHKNY